MNILVIGSRGFIGQNIEKHFIKKGDRVFACDIVDNPLDNYTKIASQRSDYNVLFKEIKYDVCINSSGTAVVSNSFKDTEYDFRLNTLNVLKILDSIKKHNPECNFINISSAAVYGNPPTLPVAENTKLSPISPYGYHKLIAETILDEYHFLFGTKTCSVRIFSAYGNGLKKQLLFDISQKIFFESEIHLFGTGNETRDFIHIDDICRALDCIIEKDTFHSTKINVANGKQITINKIVQIFNENWKHDKKVIFNGNGRYGDPINWEADISLLKSYGYKQNVDIESGVKRYIEWIKKEK
jgi:dTDP-glucose 4,6-dehydratase/UDP-glucose 4-epimerase